MAIETLSLLVWEGISRNWLPKWKTFPLSRWLIGKMLLRERKIYRAQKREKIIEKIRRVSNYFHRVKNRPIKLTAQNILAPEQIMIVRQFMEVLPIDERFIVILCYQFGIFKTLTPYVRSFTSQIFLPYIT